jgi:3-methyladenine DNA glycosylase AlkD
MADGLLKELKSASDKEKARIQQGFFKTGIGEYAEGDIFLGVSVPKTRSISKKYIDLGINDLDDLIQSKYHEVRLAGLLVLLQKFEKGNSSERKKYFDFYLKHTSFINNWDLVDLTADKIIGAYLEDKDRSILYVLARSNDLWERRISILSTFHYIKLGDAKETLRIAAILLHDKHDLIRKAVGWMLREAGKRCSVEILEGFLDRYSHEMPRTMLRYAIERLPHEKKIHYMAKKY